MPSVSPLLYTVCPFDLQFSSFPLGKFSCILSFFYPYWISLNILCFYYILFNFLFCVSFCLQPCSDLLREARVEQSFVHILWLLHNFSTCLCHACSSCRTFAGPLPSTCSALHADIHVDCCVQISTQI